MTVLSHALAGVLLFTRAGHADPDIGGWIPLLEEERTGPAVGMTLLYYIVALAGVAAALWGVSIALKGQATAKVTGAWGPGSVAFEKISQGVVIAILGAGIFIAALYLTQERTSTVTTREITTNAEGTVTQEIQATS